MTAGGLYFAPIFATTTTIHKKLDLDEETILELRESFRVLRSSQEWKERNRAEKAAARVTWDTVADHYRKVFVGQAEEYRELTSSMLKPIERIIDDEKTYHRFLQLLSQELLARSDFNALLRLWDIKIEEDGYERLYAMDSKLPRSERNPELTTYRLAIADLSERMGAEVIQEAFGPMHESDFPGIRDSQPCSPKTNRLLHVSDTFSWPDR